MDEIKTELFKVMADTLTELSKHEQKIVVITQLKTVFFNHELDLQHLQPFFKEEVDETIFPCYGTIMIRILRD